MAAWRSTIEQNTPRLRRRLPSLAEEALDGVEPGGRGRRVMEDKAGMSAEPGPRLGVLVWTVIVEDHVDDLAGRDFGLEGVQEANELLMPVALHAASDHLAVEQRRARRTEWWCRSSCSQWVIVPQRPGFSGRPRWVRSGA